MQLLGGVVPEQFSVLLTYSNEKKLLHLWVMLTHITYITLWIPVTMHQANHVRSPSLYSPPCGRYTFVPCAVSRRLSNKIAGKGPLGKEDHGRTEVERLEAKENT